MTYCCQVDKGAEETGVKGFAGRPLRPRLPHLQAARRPSRGRGGNHLAEAGQELADLPRSVDSALWIGKESFTRIRTYRFSAYIWRLSILTFNF